MKTAALIAFICGAYLIASLSDENAKLKETLAGDTWCEIKYQQSTAWHKCRLIPQEELNKQVATIQY